jgi:hypothetical protein
MEFRFDRRAATDAERSSLPLVVPSGHVSSCKPGGQAAATGQQRSRTRARLLCPRADEHGSQPCVARHLVLGKFETMDHGGNDVLQTQLRWGPNTFHIHNYGVQLRVTYTTSLSGYMCCYRSGYFPISNVVGPPRYRLPGSLAGSRMPAF